MKTKKLVAIATFLLCAITVMAQQVGIASFYAKNIRSKMASGQRYHKDSMICAHRSHPFGTLLKVTHLKNHKSVVVKVADRGPFGRGRIIDLSWGAAEKLGMVAAGIAKVKVELFKGEIDSEIDTHPNDSTDLLIDYENRDYELPFLPHKQNQKPAGVPQIPTHNSQTPTPNSPKTIGKTQKSTHTTKK